MKRVRGKNGRFGKEIHPEELPRVADAVGLYAPAFMLAPSPTISPTIARLFDRRVNGGGRRAQDGEGGC